MPFIDASVVLPFNYWLESAACTLAFHACPDKMLPHPQGRHRRSKGASNGVTATDSAPATKPSFVTLPAALHSCIYAFVDPSTQLLVATTSHAFLDLYGCSLTTIALSSAHQEDPNKPVEAATEAREARLAVVGRLWAGRSIHERLLPEPQGPLPMASESERPSEGSVSASIKCQCLLTHWERIAYCRC